MHGRPLRILEVTNTALAGEWFYDQVVGLVERGHDVHVVVPEEGPLTERMERAGVPFDIIRFKGKRLSQLPRIAHAELSLLRKVREIRPDVVHAHLLKAALSCRLATFGYPPALRVTQVPGTVHLHSRLLRWPDLWTLPRDDVVIGTCHAIADRYQEMGARSVAVSYYGCDVSRFDPRTSGEKVRHEFGLTPKTPTVAMVARLYPTRMRAFRDVGVKGHEIFLQAIPAMLRKNPAAHFFIVGDDLAEIGEYRRRLEAKASDLGVTANLHFTGYRNDIPEIMAAMDVIACPSMEESACYAAVEALLMEKAVVASDVGGLPEAVHHGETGLLVPPGDPAALAAAVTDLLSRPAMGAEMGRRGRELCLRRFDRTTTVNEIEAIYRDKLKNLAGIRGGRKSLCG